MTAEPPLKSPRRYVKAVALHDGAMVQLRPDHPALTEATTVYRASAVNAADAPRLLVDGINQRKIGGRVTKGPWRSFPIFTLTLEERATCPATCHHWRDFIGNNMPFARRVRIYRLFVVRLATELARKNKLNPRGFAVRLHVLGDFYSVGYVEQWGRWLDIFPALHVFGFTAWQPGSEIGDAVRALTEARWDRFAVRLSSVTPGRDRANTAPSDDAARGLGIICPAQQNKTDCCGTCGLCWAPAAREKTIVFIGHGRRPRGKARGQRSSWFYTPAPTQARPPVKARGG